jgi:dienelactone hydrolase
VRLRVLLLAAVAALGSASAVMASPPIEAYGALPTYQTMSLAPSGKLVAMIINKGEQHVLVVRQIEGENKIVHSTTLNDRVGGVRWADDDHLYVNTHRTLNTGTDAVQEYGFLFLINLKTKATKQITGDEEKAVLGLPELITHVNGHTYGYIQAGRRLYRQDIDSEQLVQVARSGEREGDFLLTPTGEIEARMSYGDNYHRKWSVKKGENGDAVLASGEAEVGGGEILGFGRTSDTILVANNENGSLTDLREINVVDGKVGRKMVGEGDFEAFPIHDKVSRLLIGFYVGGYVDETQFLDQKLEAKWESVQAAFPNEKVAFVSSDDAKSRFVVLTEGSHDSGHYFLIDTEQKKAIPLGAQYPDIRANDVGAFEWVDYKATDGLPLKALVTLPPGYTMAEARNLPGVMLPHGGPQARDSYGFDWWAQALASRGYVVVQPEYRGSGGFGQKFERMGWGQWGRLMQTDVSDAFKAVAAKGIIDPGRTCIVGWSYGGYATMAAATLQPGLYRCAAAGAGVSDLNAMLVWTRDRGGKQGDGMRYWKQSMALNGEGDPAGAAVSPAKHAADVRGPLMLIHGREDTTVPLEQTELMANAMRNAGKPVEVVILENETHHIESPSTRTKMLQSMIGFLERNDPPNVAPKGQVIVERPSRPSR